jgi:hypothetical protein
MVRWFVLVIAMLATVPALGVEEQHYTSLQYVQRNMNIKSGYITGIATAQEVLKELSAASGAPELCDAFVAATDLTSKIGPLIAGIDA